MGLLLELWFLLFLQMAPISLPRLSFLQMAVKAYLVVPRGGVETPPPPLHELHARGVWHCVFFCNSLSLMYFLPVCVFRWCDLVSGHTIVQQLREKIVPTSQHVYIVRVKRVAGMNKPISEVPSLPALD